MSHVTMPNLRGRLALRTGRIGRAALLLRTRLSNPAYDGPQGDLELAEEFVQKCAEFQLVPSLQALPRTTAVVADAPFHDFITRDCLIGSRFAYLPLDRAMASPGRLARRKEVIVLSLRPHRHVVRKISAAAPGARVLSAINDWLPNLMVSTGLFRVPAVDEGAAESERAGGRTDYAIFATPRTGSYYLCELLFQAGVGVPKEHLRPATATLFSAAPGLQPQRFAANLTRHATAGGYFGTKLISHFLLDAVKRPSGVHLLRRWIARYDLRLIQLQRRDLVQQAASAVIAMRRDSWRLVDSEAPRNLEPPPYDYKELFRQYDAFRDQNEAMTRFLDGFPQVHRLTYEELEADPLGQLNDVLRFLGAPRREDVPEVETLKVRNARTEAFAERFREDLRKNGDL